MSLFSVAFFDVVLFICYIIIFLCLVLFHLAIVQYVCTVAMLLLCLLSLPHIIEGDFFVFPITVEACLFPSLCYSLGLEEVVLYLVFPEGS